MGLCVLYLGVGEDAPGQGWECAAWCGAPALVCLSGQRRTEEVTTIAAVSGTTGQRRVGETKKVWTGAQVLRQLASSIAQIGSTLPLYLALIL